ncbi:MAG: hypothetical protein QM765_15240 [Myxococcales bacterium]
MSVPRAAQARAVGTEADRVAASQLLVGGKGRCSADGHRAASKELADLDRLIAAVIAYEHENSKHRDAVRGRPLGSKPGSVQALFGGEKPVLRSGSVEYFRGGLSLSLASKLAPGRTKDDVRSALSGDHFERFDVVGEAVTVQTRGPLFE